MSEYKLLAVKLKAPECSLSRDWSPMRCFDTFPLRGCSCSTRLATCSKISIWNGFSPILNWTGISATVPISTPAATVIYLLMPCSDFCMPMRRKAPFRNLSAATSFCPFPALFFRRRSGTTLRLNAIISALWRSAEK